MGIFRRYSLLIDDMSTVSDLTNKIMIPESGIMDGRHQNRSVYRLPRHVFSLRLCSTHFPHLFSFSLFSTWEPVLKLINSLFLLTFLFTYYVTNLNCERSSVNFFKTSSICFASSLVGVIIIAPIWWSWKRERLDTKKSTILQALYSIYDYLLPSAGTPCDPHNNYTVSCWLFSAKCCLPLQCRFLLTLPPPLSKELASPIIPLSNSVWQCRVAAAQKVATSAFFLMQEHCPALLTL